MRFSQVSLEAVELGEGFPASRSGTDRPEANFLLALRDRPLRSAQLLSVLDYHFDLKKMSKVIVKDLNIKTF